MCHCKLQPNLVDISNSHTEFKSKLDQLEVGDWVFLMQCPDCSQLWKVDEWDKYQQSYAVKITDKESWKKFDCTALIKEKIIENRGGLTCALCQWSDCNSKQVKGSAYCVNHLWSMGARA
ncbi:metal-binding protein [Microbulbifer taiwanensis]|uniref:Metal-binding protein n=1 Tax=Microbulbifer taiwanensis TaxID=986746 RepID=A0ABW1YNR4_9GAMM|nr:metal-binding protein [Microbulbifer taiwanensis]